MTTQLNYYTNEEAHTKVCPEVSFKTNKGEIRSAPLTIHCIGSKCSDWVWHSELTDEGLRQGHCGKLIPYEKPEQ
jgi:hypothetical protein